MTSFNDVVSRRNLWPSLIQGSAVAPDEENQSGYILAMNCEKMCGILEEMIAGRFCSVIYHPHSDCRRPTVFHDVEGDVVSFSFEPDGESEEIAGVFTIRLGEETLEFKLAHQTFGEDAILSNPEFIFTSRSIHVSQYYKLRDERWGRKQLLIISNRRPAKKR